MAAPALKSSHLPPDLARPHHRRVISSHPRLLAARCSSSSEAHLAVSGHRSPVFRSVTAFAPATVANLGPCFDILGCAVDALGDTVTVSVDPSLPCGSLSISSVTAPSPAVAARLSRDPLRNCAFIAGLATLRELGVLGGRSPGVSLSLHKGLPLGSGLGSSAASAAAAATAINALFGSPLPSDDLVLAGLESEKAVSGYHADNIGPAIIGGFVLIRGYDPLDLLPLRFPDGLDLFFVLVSPEFEAPTKKMRAVLPADVPRKDQVHNASQAAALVAAVMAGDVRALGAAMSADVIVEPRRAPLIPGMAGVKKAALKAGAFGCTISGAGPTVVAVIDSEEKGREIGHQMEEAFWREGGLKARATVARLDRVGARVIGSSVD